MSRKELSVVLEKKRESESELSSNKAVEKYANEGIIDDDDESAIKLLTSGDELESETEMMSNSRID
jgi:hypothetical protein